MFPLTSCVGQLKSFLSDCLRLGHPWRIVVTLFMLVSAITAGCLPSSAPPATRILTPTSPLPLESTTPTSDRETVTTVILTPTSPPRLESTMPTVDTETVTTVSGYVVGGGDTTPKGLSDAPRKFVYNVEKEDKSFIYVAYTAYPPSPVGGGEKNKIGLNFHAGMILTGDYLKARGSYDKDTNTLIVAAEGDYIETYPEKP